MTGPRPRIRFRPELGPGPGCFPGPGPRQRTGQRLAIRKTHTNFIDDIFFKFKLR